MSNIQFDFGQGFLFAVILFVVLMVFLVLALIVSVREAKQRRDEDIARADELVKQNRADRPAPSSIIPRKVIEVVLYDSGREVAPRQSSQRRR